MNVAPGSNPKTQVIQAQNTEFGGLVAVAVAINFTGGFAVQIANANDSLETKLLKTKTFWLPNLNLYCLTIKLCYLIYCK